MKKKNDKKPINLRTDYLVFSSFAFIFILFSIYFLINTFFVTLNDTLTKYKENRIESVISTLWVLGDKNNFQDTSTLEKVMFKTASYSSFSTIVIKDNKTDKVIATTMPAYKNKKINDTALISDAVSNNKEHTLKTKDNYTIFISYDDDSNLNISQIQLQMNIIFILALILCLAMSWVLARRVIEPINKIKNAAKEFSNGNFGVKIEATKYIELNELVDSCNTMADKLSTFYKTLEQKVQDRTKELEQAIEELKNAQSMMVHSEKMKSLGELVAGIMHEINNPINFIYGNMVHLDNYSKDLMSVIDKYSELDESLNQETVDAAIDLKKEIDYDFLKEDLPSLIKSCHEGADRAKNIIQDLKNFSRIDANVISTINLPKEIDTTLNILHNKIKNRIEVHKEYAPNMPQIDGLGGQLNQVFMNILDNATFAIKDKGDIYIRLNFDDKYALIEIEDNGCGMSEKTREKIFDPFFTTKPVGQGTGLGMSISYKVIKTHSGEITVSSEEGKGTIFRIKLPIEYTPDEHALAR